MATLLPATLQDIQDEIHTLTTGDDVTPDPTDDQWISRLRYINLAIRIWLSQDVEWKELSGTYSGSVIAANTTVYDLGNADSFNVLNSLIQLKDATGNLTFIDVIKPEDRIKYPNNTGQYAYVTGNAADGYSLVIGWVPKTGDNLIGTTIQFDYQKTANRLSKTTDKPIMRDPSYISFWSAAQELQFNGSTNLAQTYLDQADDAMRLMKIRNEMAPAYASNALVDVEVTRNNDAFGD
jgi:hypothetical protein